MYPIPPKTKAKWLEEGYRHFAESGPEKLSIKKISEELGSSRASFYHFFGDMEIFMEELLTMHWGLVENFNQRGKAECRQLFPDLYNLLSEYPIPLQFSMQLFHHRSVPVYNFLFIKTYKASAQAFVLKLFKEAFELRLPESEIFSLWLTVGESWYARLNPEDLSASTLQLHAKEIMQTVARFADSQLYAALRAQNHL